MVLDIGSDPTQQRRPKENSGDHLTDDLRLTEALRRQTDDPARDKDGGQFQKEMDGNRCGHGLRPRVCLTGHFSACQRPGLV
jgi:hypothetical protein